MPGQDAYIKLVVTSLRSVLSMAGLWLGVCGIVGPMNGVSVGQYAVGGLIGLQS